MSGAPPVPRRERAVAALVARREIVDLVSDWRILGPAFLLIVVFPVLMVVVSGQTQGFLARRNPEFAFAALVPLALMLVGFFPISFSIILALESFAGEKERNTLEALLATPVSDRALYLGKMAAAVLPPLVASYLAMALYLAGIMAFVPVPLDSLVLGAVVLLNLGQAGVMVAGALIISSHTTSVRAANMLAAFIILPLSVLIQLSNALLLWGGAPALWLIGVALVVFAVLLVRMGLRLFNREQILAREMDDLRPNGLVRTFRQFWRQSPRGALALRAPGTDQGALLAAAPPLTLRRLYRRDIPTLLRLRWPELAIVTLALGVALALGWGIATIYPIDMGDLVASAGPGGLIAERVQDVAGGSDPLAALLTSLPSILFRLVLLSLVLILLAVMSFGTLPVLFMMALAGALGFLFGQLALAGASPLALAALLLLPSFLFPALALTMLTAFAIRFGLTVAAPPPGFSLGDSLILALVEYLKIAALALPLLFAGEVVQVVLIAVARGVLR
ncbi:MAG TPA: ABC transporter permease subunit [Chloroflexia bacterium]|nr:ABC transporter permease subunit [Chloroflexia bacterium]